MKYFFGKITILEKSETFVKKRFLQCDIKNRTYLKLSYL